MPNRRRILRIALGIACALGAGGRAGAAEPAACQTVRMSDPGWSDIAATNGVAGLVLTALGYQQKVATLSVPITYEALKNGQLDVFLGNWMPAQKRFVDPLMEARQVDLLRHNLEGAKFTLAVPDYVAASGVHTFSDLAGHAGAFNRTIYGIEPGAPANQNIHRMLDAGDFGLKGWQLVESSEQGMLSEVARRVAKKQGVVFLAWEPHPMNVQFQITYLAGGDSYFGPNYGNTTVNTLARKGYAELCPNVARLFSQLAFTVGMENELMNDTAAKKATPRDAAAQYVKAHPDLLDHWLNGVTARDGRPGLPVVQDSLELGH